MKLHTPRYLSRGQSSGDDAKACTILEFRDSSTPSSIETDPLQKTWEDIQNSRLLLIS